MADIRINSLPTTATSFNTDDYIALDGASGGTRKMLAATLPLTDVTFGSSGPSAKSSIAARASRQGLVFNATSGATISPPAFGTSDLTVAVWLNPATFTYYQRIVVGSTNSLLMDIGGNAVVRLAKNGSAPISGSSTVLTANKNQLLVYTRASGATGTFYLNGVQVETFGDTNDYSAAVTRFGTDPSGGSDFNGTMSGPYIYNRALSAAEVVALYEAGVPAGADYNTATNTSQTSGTFALATGSGTVTGASATGFTASITGNSFGVVSAATARSGITVGSKFLVTFSATLTSGDTPKVYLANTATAGNTTGVTASVNVSSGSNSIVLTGSSNVSTTLYLNFQPPSTGSASYAISSITITPLGLLLAPDAGQAGGGLTWYDTSGNAANITLPASGVSWNVPTSAKTATAWSFSSAVSASTGTNPATGSGGGLLFAQQSSSGALTNYASIAGTRKNNSANDFVDLAFHTGSPTDSVAITERLRISAQNGNVLLGTTTDSSNGKLQLTSHTTSAGGIGFGTDTSLWRVRAGSLGINETSSVNGTRLEFYEAGSYKANLHSYLGVLYLGSDAAGGSLVLRSGAGTTALTLDSSQNATFSGRVKSSDQTTVSLTASTAYNLIATSDVLTVNTLANSIVMLTVTGSDGVDGGFCGYYLLNLNVAFGTYTVTTIASGLPQNAGSAYTFTFTLDANYLKVTCGKNTGFRYNYSVLEGPNLS